MLMIKILAAALLVRWIWKIISFKTVDDCQKPCTELTSDPYYTYVPDKAEIKKMRTKLGYTD